MWPTDFIIGWKFGDKYSWVYSFKSMTSPHPCRTVSATARAVVSDIIVFKVKRAVADNLLQWFDEFWQILFSSPSALAIVLDPFAFWRINAGLTLLVDIISGFINVSYFSKVIVFVKNTVLFYSSSGSVDYVLASQNAVKAAKSLGFSKIKFYKTFEIV